jgi:hypothetical protein
MTQMLKATPSQYISKLKYEQTNHLQVNNFQMSSKDVSLNQNKKTKKNKSNLPDDDDFSKDKQESRKRKVSKSNSESSAEIVSSIKPEASKAEFNRDIWKLHKPKYVIILKLCPECQDAMFTSKKKYFRSEGKFHLAIGMCETCIGVNINATDLLAPSKNTK